MMMLQSYIKPRTIMAMLCYFMLGLMAVKEWFPLRKRKEE